MEIVYTRHKLITELLELGIIERFTESGNGYKYLYKLTSKATDLRNNRLNF